MSVEKSKNPEILAPVGSWEMCLAAVHNGADAVYLGFPHFNARGRTQDFSVQELKFMIEFCHLYGVKVFLACNILIFEGELSEVEAQLREILPLSPDAFIVQDIGLVRLIKKLAPDQAVHASTQMTVTSHEAIALTEELGIERYVLGREVSIAEMAKIRAATSKELEVFVHGALCVAYSGQCLTSESHGGRSANRGQCAQSCRLDYRLLVDSEIRNLGDKRHLVSPQDLCGLGDIDRLIEIGIDSFKIEGRLKTPEYVASTVRNYKEVSRMALTAGAQNDISARCDELGLTFSRGRFNGWYDGVNHQKLVDARFSKPHGNFLGHVRVIEGSFIEIDSAQMLTVGDGVVFRNFEEGTELGGIIFSAKETERGLLRIRLGEEFSLSRLKIGMHAYHNSSSKLERALRQTYSDKSMLKKISLSGVLSGKLGEQPVFELKDDCGNSVRVISEAVLQSARSAPLSEESAKAELGALTGTAFELTKFMYKVEGDLFLHTKELKLLRRNAIEKLSKKRVDRPARILKRDIESWRMSVYAGVTGDLSGAPSKAALNVLIRDESQLDALRGLDLDAVYLDFEFNKDYENALRRIREMGFRGGIATTRILKPGELGHLKYIERLQPDVLLVRNLGALHYFQGKNMTLVGDFSLNISNGISAAWFLSKGLEKVTPSYDLNSWQLCDVVDALPADRFEVTVHQYMPAFHMEHCVYAAFLSKGTSFRDCGRPCEKHRVSLVDRDGVIHPLKPDAECRNTMFQGKPQAALKLVPDLLARGVRSFRVEALFESALEIRSKAEAYLALIRGNESVEAVSAKLGVVERYGVTEGQLFNATVYKDKKKTSLSVLS